MPRAFLKGIIKMEEQPLPITLEHNPQFFADMTAVLHKSKGEVPGMLAELLEEEDPEIVRVIHVEVIRQVLDAAGLDKDNIAPSMAGEHVVAWASGGSELQFTIETKAYTLLKSRISYIDSDGTPELFSRIYFDKEIKEVDSDDGQATS